MAAVCAPRTSSGGWPAGLQTPAGAHPTRSGWLAAFLGVRARDAEIAEIAAGTSFGWSPHLAVVSGFALLLAAFAANASRLGEPWAVACFYVAIAAIFLPALARTLQPAASRQEVVTLLVIVTMALFVMRVIRAPLGFVDHDEFLHWATAADILETGRLFVPNALLPVSPVYPGLELATTALIGMSGLDLFAAALIVLAAARLLLILALFLFFEQISGSARIAAIGAFVYMGSAAFLIFDLHFSYESLAIPLAIVVLMAGSGPDMRGQAFRWHLVLFASLVAALAVTHHLTSYFAAGILSAVAAAELLRKGGTGVGRRRALALAAIAVALPVAWSNFVGNPTGGYLGPVIENGLKEVVSLATRTSGRPLFVSDDGVLAPAWQRYLTMGGVALIGLGLLTGFLRTLVRNGLSLQPANVFSLSRLRGWHSSALLVLALLSVAYPVSVVFRLTRSGWEIGNRLGALSFFGVAIVVAIAAAGYWQGASLNRFRAACVAAAVTVIVIAGAISSEGPRILVPAQYEVSADSSSVEPMGISVAQWTRQWLGPAQMFASDRINRLLLSTYGRQTVATTLADWRDTGSAILSPTFRLADRQLLRDLRIDFLLIDMRMTQALPAVGVYFDGGETDRHHRRPPSAQALLKFNDVPSIDRLFDNGYAVIFDVRRLPDA